jgi:hypothetical protein
VFHADRSGRDKEQRTGDLVDDDIGVSGLLLVVLAARVGAVGFVAVGKGTVLCNLGCAVRISRKLGSDFA